jgi:hypothetical protein
MRDVFEKEGELYTRSILELSDKVEQLEKEILRLSLIIRNYEKK